MHPVIRLIGFMVLGAGLMVGGVKEVAVLALLVAALYLGSRTSPAGAWPLLRRARWLFLSLLILYFWFSPGRAVLPYYGMPTVEGIEDGVFRIAALILLTLAVHLLLQTTGREQLVAALCWLAKPLNIFSGAGDRFAVRAMLTLETVTHARHIFSQECLKEERSSRWRRITDTAGTLFQTAVARAESMTAQVIALPESYHPPLYQWLYPLALAFVIWRVR
jgi:hypothetical protein